jgi:DNA-binding response OmpR family regulator
MQNILIVEDDRSLSNGIILALREKQFAFSQAYNLAEAEDLLSERLFELIILDINLPDGNGLDLLTKVRRSIQTPVILLTANDMELDIVTGLELGADDYITKPFSLMVLRARVNTQLRKQLKQPHTQQIQIDDYSFHFERMEFYKGSLPIELSKTEQKLLKLLIENRGNAVPRSRLVDRIWSDSAEYVDENALSVTIKRLRDKLEDDPATPKYIKTIYGIGYTWVVK